VALEVTKGSQSKLMVAWYPASIRLWLAYDSGLNYEIYVSQEEWDRMVAWVELQRKEEALKSA